MKKLISKRKYEDKTQFVLPKIHFADAIIQFSAIQSHSGCSENSRRQVIRRRDKTLQVSEKYLLFFILENLFGDSLRTQYKSVRGERWAL